MSTAQDNRELDTAEALQRNGFSFHFKSPDTVTSVCGPTVQARDSHDRRTIVPKHKTESLKPCTWVKPDRAWRMSCFLTFPIKIQALTFSRSFPWVVVTLESFQPAVKAGRRGGSAHKRRFSIPRGSNKRIQRSGTEKAIRLTPDTFSLLKQTDGRGVDGRAISFLGLCD